jgi:hypothetical protein
MPKKEEKQSCVIDLWNKLGVDLQTFLHWRNFAREWNSILKIGKWSDLCDPQNLKRFKKNWQICIGSQKYRRIFFFLNLHILFIAKFGYIIFLWLMTTLATSQNWPQKYIYSGVDRQPYCEKTFLSSSFWENSFTFDPICEPFQWKRQI